MFSMDFHGLEAALLERPRKGGSVSVTPWPTFWSRQFPRCPGPMGRDGNRGYNQMQSPDIKHQYIYIYISISNIRLDIMDISWIFWSWPWPNMAMAKHGHGHGQSKVPMGWCGDGFCLRVAEGHRGWLCGDPFLVTGNSAVEIRWQSSCQGVAMKYPWLRFCYIFLSLGRVWLEKMWCNVSCSHCWMEELTSDPPVENTEARGAKGFRREHGTLRDSAKER